MQGMMIQDFSTGPQISGSPVATAPQESPGQSFGNLLGREAATPVEQGEEHLQQAPQPTAQDETGKAEAAPFFMAALFDLNAAYVESSENADLSAETPLAPAQEATGKAEAAPFFMAALFDQNAAYVESSENADLITAAERTQELIGAWLQPQEDGEGELEEIMTAVLEVLEQTTEVALESTAEVVESLPAAVLTDAEIVELRELIAVMLQSGQVPESFQGHPLVAQLQRQLELVPPLAAVAGAKGNEFQENSLISSPAATSLALDAENVPTESAAQPAAGAGMHENLIAKMLTQRQEPAEGSGRATEAVPVISGEPDVEGDLQSEATKPGVRILNTDLPLHQAPQVAGAARQQAQPGEIAVPRLMQLPSGQHVAESQLVDQVVTHLAGSSNGETGRMRLRLQPAELGSVRLDLIVDGDRLRAHLQAQTQQVQEVLERHLPQLREALQQQGLKIDEFRVDVQSDQDQAAEQRFAWQQQQQGHSSQGQRQDDWQPAELGIPLQPLLQTAEGGISLRV